MPVVFGEQRIELGDAASPELFEMSQKRLRPANGLGVASHDALPPPRNFGDEVCGLEHRDVLLHSREAHVVVAGELGDRGLADERAAHDIAPRRVGQGPEDTIYPVVVKINLCNHLVVRYVRRKPLSTPERQTARDSPARYSATLRRFSRHEENARHISIRIGIPGISTSTMMKISLYFCTNGICPRK